jgi:predicted O-methyltransferase YrrM
MGYCADIVINAIIRKMNITDRLQAQDPTLVLHNEGFWNEPLDPQKTGFTSFNDAGIETETGEFLYAMVRLLKPARVLETGTHIGVSAAYMGTALKDNKQGHLDTIEFLSENYNRALQRIADLQLREFVTVTKMDAKAFIEDINGGLYQLVLLDTEPQTRFAELVSIYPFIQPGGFVFIHDLHRHMHQVESLRDNPDHPGQPFWPYGPVTEEMKQFVREDKLRPFHFPTPRGLTGFYKPSPEDYQWK